MNKNRKKDKMDKKIQRRSKLDVGNQAEVAQ